MAFWTLDILALDGTTTEVSSAPFRSARASWAADGTGALEVELRAADVASGIWLPGRRRVLLRDAAGTPRYQGWLDRLERAGAPNVGPDGLQFRAASRGLAAILDERVVHGDFGETTVLATNIVQDLLDHISAQAYDKTGFTAGTVFNGPSATRSRYYCDGEVIKDLIDELAETGSGGFAWEIDELGQFNAWVGGRGTDLSGSVTLAPADATGWACVEDTTEMATYCTGIAQANEPVGCGPPLVIDFTSERVAYGRREVVITDDVAADEPEMEGKTTEELRARVASRINLKTSWIEGLGPWAFGTVGIGDVVNAELGAAFGGDADVRCIGISVTMEPGVHEFVETEWEAA